MKMMKPIICLLLLIFVIALYCFYSYGMTKDVRTSESTSNIIMKLRSVKSGSSWNVGPQLVTKNEDTLNSEGMRGERQDLETDNDKGTNKENLNYLVKKPVQETVLSPREIVARVQAEDINGNENFGESSEELEYVNIELSKPNETDLNINNNMQYSPENRVRNSTDTRTMSRGNIERYAFQDYPPKPAQGEVKVAGKNNGVDQIGSSLKTGVPITNQSFDVDLKVYNITDFSTGEASNKEHERDLIKENAHLKHMFIRILDDLKLSVKLLRPDLNDNDTSKVPSDRSPIAKKQNLVKDEKEINEKKDENQKVESPRLNNSQSNGLEVPLSPDIIVNHFFSNLKPEQQPNNGGLHHHNATSNNKILKSRSLPLRDLIDFLHINSAKYSHKTQSKLEEDVENIRPLVEVDPPQEDRIVQGPGTHHSREVNSFLPRPDRVANYMNSFEPSNNNSNKHPQALTPIVKIPDSDSSAIDDVFDDVIAIAADDDNKAEKNDMKEHNTLKQQLISHPEQKIIHESEFYHSPGNQLNNTGEDTIEPGIIDNDLYSNIEDAIDSNLMQPQNPNIQEENQLIETNGTTVNSSMIAGINSLQVTKRGTEGQVDVLQVGSMIWGQKLFENEDPEPLLYQMISPEASSRLQLNLENSIGRIFKKKTEENEEGTKMREDEERETYFPDRSILETSQREIVWSNEWPPEDESFLDNIQSSSLEQEDASSLEYNEGDELEFTENEGQELKALEKVLGNIGTMRDTNIQII